MRWVFLSPHPDDAALCAGGLIFDLVRSGAAVEIWTVFAGVPPTEDLSSFARHMHSKWRTASARETIEVRRREDSKAAELLGARASHFNFLDAIYRNNQDGTALYADPVGAALDLLDAMLPAQICDVLVEGLRRDDPVVTLLGIGDHVDHVLVRQAAELLRRPLLYVADFPYILKHSESVVSGVAGMTSTLRPVSEAGVTAWIEAVCAYRSQLEAIFDRLDPGASVRDYCARYGGVRLWARPPGGTTGGLDSAPEA
jgi:LmbE family N-acetylglucosaminyl deacetylase